MPFEGACQNGGLLRGLVYLLRPRAPASTEAESLGTLEANIFISVVWIITRYFDLWVFLYVVASLVASR